LVDFFRPLCFACGVLLCGDLLPPVALIASRRVDAVHPGHHLDIRVSELTGNELVRGASSDGAHRVEMPGIVHAVVWQTE
jgi:hypothetical protein